MRVAPYVNFGTWVARCPRCPSAEHAGQHPVTGHVGGLAGGRFRCGPCGLTCGVDWPAGVDDIWRALSARPDPATRNWTPPETLHDLIVENLTHGIIPDPEAIDPSRPWLLMVGDAIISGADLALPEVPRLAIGGVR